MVADGTGEVQALTEAERLDREVDALVAVVQQPLVRLAQVIHRIREDKLFEALGHESFEAWISKGGRMFEKVGLTPDLLPEGESEITKLAQIARLEDAEIQRTVLENGSFPTADGSRPLSEIPVRELTRLVDERLGREPRIRSLSETYESGGTPWEGPDSFREAPEPVRDAMTWDAVAHEPWGSTRAERTDAPWSRIVEDLTRMIEDLSGPDRDDAINAVARLYHRLVG